MIANIGDKVNYIRHVNGSEASTGEGFIKAWGVDPENRVIALVIDCQSLEAFNTYERCINPTPDFIEEFKQFTKEVRHITDTENAKIKKLTDNANTMIGELHEKVLGSCVALPEGASPNK